MPLTRFLLLAGLCSATRLFAVCPSVEWTLQHEHATADTTWSMVVVDYDEDDIPDLVYVESAVGGGRLLTRRGVGDGTFEAPLTIPDPAYGPAAADFDGDGHVDLAVIRPGGAFAILPGTGSGFGALQSYSPDYYVTQIMAGNYDSDAAMELVALSSVQDIFVFYDNDGGDFVEAQRVPTGPLPVAAAVADFDGDGRYDVAIGDATAKTVSVHFRNVDGTFAPPATMPAGDRPMDVAAGDINGDGKLDFAVSQWTDATVRLYSNAGSRQFTQTTLSLVPPNALGGYGGQRIAIRDFNADGHLDLLANGGGLTTFIGAGDGTFLTPTWPFTATTLLAVADLDIDGVLDVITNSYLKQAIFNASCATQVYAYTRSRTISIGQDAKIEVAISGFGTTSPPDRGTVTIGDVTVAVDANGRASLAVPGLALGTHQLTAAFSGNSALSAANAAPVTIVVTTRTTQTILFTNSSPAVYGTAWPVLVKVTSPPDTFLLGPYLLENDGVPISHTVNEGTLQLQFDPGPHTLRARYEGGISGNPPSESPLLEMTALKATPTFVSSGTLTVRTGTAHALLFSLSGPAGTSTPTGTLQWFEGNSLLATTTLVDGSASVTLPVLARGAHDINVTYSGDTKFLNAARNVTVQVLPNVPLFIEARALPAGMHIAYVLPSNTTATDLYRRVAGTTTWQWVSNWNRTTGLDPDVLPRGVVYEYQLDALLSTGTLLVSNIDSAILFTDDLLAIGTAIKREHFVHLQQAVNEVRGMASLPPFNFEAGFGTSAIVRASHINGLRTALNQARSALGMTMTTFPSATAGATKILASDIQQLRELAR